VKNTEETVNRNRNLKPWRKGESGNPRGRPPTGQAIAELARAEVDKHGLLVKLGNIAARGRGDKQFRAIQLLLNYAFGQPRSTNEPSLQSPDRGVRVIVEYEDIPPKRETPEARDGKRGL
jgi:hypothetical protein